MHLRLVVTPEMGAMQWGTNPARGALSFEGEANRLAGLLLEYEGELQRLGEILDRVTPCPRCGHVEQAN